MTAETRRICEFGDGQAPTQQHSRRPICTSSPIPGLRTKLIPTTKPVMHWRALDGNEKTCNASRHLVCGLAHLNCCIVGQSGCKGFDLKLRIRGNRTFTRTIDVHHNLHPYLTDGTPFCSLRAQRHSRLQFVMLVSRHIHSAKICVRYMMACPKERLNCMQHIAQFLKVETKAQPD